MYSNATAAMRAVSAGRGRAAESIERYGLFFAGISMAIWASSFVVGFERAVLALFVLGFAAAVVGIVQPVVGLFGIGILCTIDAISRFFLLNTGPLPWNTLNYWLLGVMALQLPVLLRFQPGPLRIFSCFMGVAGLQLLYSMEPMLGLQHLLGAFVLYGLVIYYARASREDGIWIWLGLINGSVAAAGGFIYYLQKSELIPINANAAAYFPLTGLFSICLGFPYARRRWGTQMTLLCLATANLAWVFLSGSRGALLIGVICFGFLFQAMRGLGQRLFLLGMILVFLGLISVRFAEFKQATMARVEKIFSRGETIEARTSGRSDIVRVGWTMFATQPWGVGTGNFKPYYAKMSGRGYIGFKPGREVEAHAAWIKVLAENGVIGVGLFAMFVFSFAYMGWLRRMAGLLPLGILVSAVLGLAFVSTEFQGKGLWFLAAGGLVLLVRKGPRAMTKEQVKEGEGEA